MCGSACAAFKCNTIDSPRTCVRLCLLELTQFIMPNCFSKHSLLSFISQIYGLLFQVLVPITCANHQPRRCSRLLACCLWAPVLANVKLWRVIGGFSLFQSSTLYLSGNRIFLCFTPAVHSPLRSSVRAPCIPVRSVSVLSTAARGLEKRVWVRTVWTFSGE